MTGKLKLAFHRWQCNRFGHPFHCVHNMFPRTLDNLTGEAKYCAHCQRVFDVYMPHSNCRCSVDYELEKAEVK